MTQVYNSVHDNRAVIGAQFLWEIKGGIAYLGSGGEGMGINDITEDVLKEVLVEVSLQGWEDVGVMVPVGKRKTWERHQVTKHLVGSGVGRRWGGLHVDTMSSFWRVYYETGSSDELEEKALYAHLIMCTFYRKRESLEFLIKYYFFDISNACLLQKIWKI